MKPFEKGREETERVEWIEKCENAILESDAWKTLSQTIHEMLSDRLYRDNVGFFGDLSSLEQMAYIQQIKTYDLKNHPAYENFRKILEVATEKSITSQLNKISSSRTPTFEEDVQPSRLETILEMTAKGCSTLLQPFSLKQIQFELISKLKNVNIPPSLRKEIWRLLLSGVFSLFNLFKLLSL